MLTLKHISKGILKNKTNSENSEVIITETNDLTEQNINIAFEELYKNPENTITIHKPPFLIEVFYKNVDAFLYDEISIKIKQDNVKPKLANISRKQGINTIKKYLL